MRMFLEVVSGTDWGARESRVSALVNGGEPSVFSASESSSTEGTDIVLTARAGQATNDQRMFVTAGIESYHQ
jgi:hypothetical protein